MARWRWAVSVRRGRFLHTPCTVPCACLCPSSSKLDAERERVLLGELAATRRLVERVLDQQQLLIQLLADSRAATPAADARPPVSEDLGHSATPPPTPRAAPAQPRPAVQAPTAALRMQPSVPSAFPIWAGPIAQSACAASCACTKRLCPGAPQRPASWRLYSGPPPAPPLPAPRPPPPPRPWPPPSPRWRPATCCRPTSSSPRPRRRWAGPLGARPRPQRPFPCSRPRAQPRAPQALRLHRRLAASSSRAAWAAWAARRAACPWRCPRPRPRCASSWAPPPREAPSLGLGPPASARAAGGLTRTALAPVPPTRLPPRPPAGPPARAGAGRRRHLLALAPARRPQRQGVRAARAAGLANRCAMAAVAALGLQGAQPPPAPRRFHPGDEDMENWFFGEGPGERGRGAEAEPQGGAALAALPACARRMGGTRPASLCDAAPTGLRLLHWALPGALSSFPQPPWPPPGDATLNAVLTFQVGGRPAAACARPPPAQLAPLALCSVRCGTALADARRPVLRPHSPPSGCQRRGWWTGAQGPCTATPAALASQ
jgi:hypothetical protein